MIIHYWFRYCLSAWQAVLYLLCRTIISNRFTKFPSFCCYKRHLWRFIKVNSRYFLHLISCKIGQCYFDSPVGYSQRRNFYTLWHQWWHHKSEFYTEDKYFKKHNASILSSKLFMKWVLVLFSCDHHVTQLFHTMQKFADHPVTQPICWVSQ